MQFPYGSPPAAAPSTGDACTRWPRWQDCSIHQGAVLISPQGTFQRGSFSLALFNAVVPSVPPCSPPSRARGWEVVVLRAYCDRERWDSSGELCCCLLSPSAAEPLRTMAGNVLRLRVAPASPPAGALSAWGRCFARAALFGADKLRKPECRMEGSVKSVEPGAAGLCSGFPRHGRGAAILESALQPPAARG